MAGYNPDSEDALENAVMELFESRLGWNEVVKAFTEHVGSKNPRGAASSCLE